MRKTIKSKKTVKVLPNDTKSWAIKLSKKVEELLLTDDYRVVKRNSKSDYTICIGGDGTIMYHNYLKLLSGKIIGIGGEKSVVAQIHRDNWKEVTNLLKNGKSKYLHMLDIQVGNKKLTAINDVVLHSKTFRVVKFNLQVGPKKYEFLADGVILATPMGSTAYAYSAGGSILPLKSHQNIIVAVAPYLRGFEPLKTSRSVKLSANENCAVLVDGILIGESKSINVKKGKTWSYLTL